MSFQVDTQIPHSNGCNISIREKNGTAVVSFSPHPHGGPEALWFCFRLKRTDRGSGEAKLILENPTNLLGGSRPETFRPVIRYEEEEWQRLTPGEVKELPDGRLEVSWLVRAPEDYLDFALCYPYGKPELEKLMEAGRGFWQQDIIGVSQKGRPILRLSNDYGQEGGSRPGLYLLARQHSGETPGSWVLDGFLRYTASLDKEAPLVWAVPFANIDGVEQGDYGKDNFPYDLNRAWGAPPMRYETLVLKRDLARWKARCRPVLAIDFHAPGASENDGIYCFLQKPGVSLEKYEEGKGWSDKIAAKLGPKFAAPSFGRIARYSSRWETANFTTFCAAELDVCALSFETPYFSIKEHVLTMEDYREAGARIAEAVISMIR